MLCGGNLFKENNMLLLCNFQYIDGEKFSLKIEGHKRKLELKSNSNFTTQEWINLI